MLEGLPVLRPPFMLVVPLLLLAGQLPRELVGGRQVRLQRRQVRGQRGQLVLQGRDVR